MNDAIKFVTYCFFSFWIRSSISIFLIGDSSSTATIIAQVHLYIHSLKRDSTIRGRGSAMKCFHNFMDDTNTDILEDLQSCGDDKLKGEIVICCILDFATWLKKNPVQE